MIVSPGQPVFFVHSRQFSHTSFDMLTNSSRGMNPCRSIIRFLSARLRLWNVITFHKRKRAERNRIIDRQGFIPREEFVNISKEVCENCRECTKNTGCPGLTIIDTDYGEKIGIDQSTCVSDTYCTKIMACPSFEKVIVTRNKPPRPRVKRIPLDNIPPPARHEFTDTWSAFISGVGGMGVGVMSSVLARAGTKEGYHVRFND